MPDIDQMGVRNKILRALPPAEFKLVMGSVTRIELELGQNLHRAGDIIDYLYFIDSGFTSVLTVLSDGQPLEIGLIGREGLVGVNVVLGATNSYSETMCQTSGGAWRIPAAAFRDLLPRCPRLAELLLRYIYVFNIQVAQTAACNAHHDLGQRLARWLLAAHDRSEVPELSLTQDLIAVMLGVRRSTVSIAAATLQKAGVIRYQHGRITILDRGGLENAACECYESVASEYRRMLLGPPEAGDAIGFSALREQ
ncbi:MAG: Crp/Fnr family transcriptional regulator [Alphaproteobacteria bacterium]|nr:Crp/Fnr family transcriptional regulator [Alphaproteobacteria bacterium]